MSITFEDILSSICSRVDAQPSSGFQKVFLLGDEKEAQLAQDVLTAHGFTVKLYRENGDSRMYIPQPDATAEKQLPAALVYARAMKTIKQGLDMLRQADSAGSPDYHIGLTSVSEFDKKISIHLALPANTLPQRPSPAQAASTAPLPQAAARHVKLPHPKKKKEIPTRGLLSGPEIARQPWFRKRHGKKPDGLRQQMALYVKGNMASASFIVMFVFIVMVIVYSLFIVSKGWLCPDFAGNKKEENTAWYCR